MSKGSGGDTLMMIATLYMLASCIMTLFFGMFLQWIPILGAIVVAGWATQAASGKSKKGKRGRR